MTLKLRDEGKSTLEFIKLEKEYAANTYHSLPVCYAKAEGARVWDPEGREYIDFLSAYSALNHGHCHPKIVKALCDQAKKLSLSSRAFYNEELSSFSEFVCNYFGYEMMLPMNTGVEAVETSIKLARCWGYVKKKIPSNEAIVLAVDGNFHGRSIAVISMSTDPSSYTNFGPYLPNVGPRVPNSDILIRYNNLDDLEKALDFCGDKVAGFIVEPIQGEAGICVPDDDYLKKAYDLCKKYNVLFICDEVQTGIARTGKLLCSEYAGFKPDITILGKSLSGGLYPVSVVLSSREIMMTLKPNTHGSTFGGNPLGCAVARAALEVVESEGLVQKSMKLGKVFRSQLMKIDSPVLKLVQGKGLFNAIVIDDTKTNGRTAWDLCLLLKERGLLAKPTHDKIVRFSPPLTISFEQLEKSIDIIKKAILDLPFAEIPIDPVHS